MALPASAQLVSDTLNAVPNPVSLDPTAQAFFANRQTLQQSFSLVVGTNPTPDKIQAWEAQNGALLAAQQNLALEMGANASLQPLPVVVPVVPTGVSATLHDFLIAGAALANARAQIHNQLLDGLPQEVNDDQMKQMQQREEQLFAQQQGAAVQAQADRAKVLVEEAAHQPWPVPPPLIIPAGTTPAMQAFLTLGDQLLRGEFQLHNRNLALSATAQDAALQQWHQSQAIQYARYQAMAQNLNPASTSN